MKSILILAALAFIAYFVVQKVRSLDAKEEGKTKENKEGIGKYYSLRKNFFSYREKPFFDELKKQNDNQYVVLSKVRMEDIVGVTPGLERSTYNKMRNHIKSRHVDFVLLGQQGNILAVIELDDKSHDTAKAKVTDGYKNDIFAFVEVKFYRVKVGEVYAEKINNILTEVKEA